MRSHLIFVLTVMLACSLPAQSSFPNHTTRASFPNHTTSGNASVELAPAKVNGANPLPPDGWRRTVKGWEHTSTWNSFEADSPKSINEWIFVHRQREPSWAQSSFAFLRKIPPVAIALVQIIVVTLLYEFTLWSKRRSKHPQATS